MHRIVARSARRISPRVIGLLACASTALGVMTPVASAQQVFSSGGAREWVAFNPDGRNLGQVQFLQKIINIVNTSTVPNRYSIFLEPEHRRLCEGTLAPGETTICPVRFGERWVGGYFQVIAAQPVLMGGYSDVPVMRYAQEKQVYIADPSTGVVQYIPFVWQPGCPPRSGSGCPTSATVGGGRGGVGRGGAIEPPTK